MSTTELITIVLTSSVLSAGLTATVNWYLQSNNYRNDYYKKLLDKRIDAYESAQQISALISGNIQLKDGKVCQTIFALGNDYYGNFYLKIQSAIDKAFWLNQSTSKK